MKDICLATALLALSLSVSAGAADLESGFKAPPHAAKPHTWYHLMNGNVTKAGITRDFEELAKVGIGGVRCSTPAATSRRAR